VGRVRAGPARNSTFSPLHTQSQAHSVYRLPHAIRVSCFLSLRSTGRRNPFIYYTPSRPACCSPAPTPSGLLVRPAASGQLAAPAPSGQQWMWMSARAPDGQRISFSRTPDDQQRMSDEILRSRSAGLLETAGRWALERPRAGLRSRRRSVHGDTFSVCVASWTLRPLCAASLRLCVSA
jgi:hypothetical protein